MPANLPRIYFVYFCTRFHLYLHVYALLLIGRGLSLLEVATIESVVIGFMFLMEVPTGVLADRLGRKWSVVIWVALMLLAELLFLFSRDYTAYLLVGALTGTGFAFASGAVEALIYDSLPAEDRDAAMKRAMGRYGAIGQIAFFASPIVGGLLLADPDPARFDLAIALTAAMLGLGLLAALTLREPPTDWSAERTSARAILRAGWAQIRTSEPLRRLALVTVLLTPFTGALITTLAPPYLAANAVPPFMIGLALSMGSLLAAAAQMNVTRIERWVGGPRAGLMLLALLPGVGYGLLALAAGPVATWLIIVWLYGTNDLKNPLLSARQNALIPARARATTLSLINMGVSLYVALITPLYAALAMESAGLAFAVMGAVIVVAAVGLRVDRLGAA